MKRRLNILCVLVILVLSYSVFQNIYNNSGAFVDGVKAGWEAADNSTEFSTVPEYLGGATLIPDNFAIMTDSIFNEKTGKYTKAHIHEVTVALDQKSNTLYNVAIIAYFLEQIALILAIIWFIKVIIQINKAHIFSWKNVKLLRKLGWVLIINFVLSVIPIISNAIDVLNGFSTPGYKIYLYDTVSYLTLTLGLVTLIIAEAFAMGLRLTQEQELTI